MELHEEPTMSNSLTEGFTETFTKDFQPCLGSQLANASSTEVTLAIHVYHSNLLINRAVLESKTIRLQRQTLAA
jgi:hypothetical protein